jgi:SAM-dependent methyltransferase
VKRPSTYEVSAKHYDAAYAVKADLVDLPFYLELAKKSRGPVLEIGCGTGRVLLPVARAGIEIHGVDSSRAMLGVLKGHVASEPPAVRQRIHLHRGDMRSLRLKKKFALVLMPFRPLQHMHTLADQIAALRTAAFHLGRNGRLAFDVFCPKYEMIFSGIGQEIPEMEWPAAGEPGRTVRRFFRKDSVDKINQAIYITFLYRTYDGDRVVREESEGLVMTYFTYPHLQALFALAGLKPVAEWGSFTKTPIDNNADQMIFILKKSESTRKSR